MTTPNNSDQAAMHDELRAVADEMRAWLDQPFVSLTPMRRMDVEAFADRIAALSAPANEACADCHEAAAYLCSNCAGARYATPPPAPAAHAGGEAVPVDALRELAEKWRAESKSRPTDNHGCGESDALFRCADELTALLSGGAAREGK